MHDPPLILEVDDDPDIARFVEVNLKSAGYDVAVAYDGEQALAMAEELLPDLVLTGIMMPRIDGFEVIRRLRSMPTMRDKIIYILTAKALWSDHRFGLRAGADDYIVKPFDPVDLIARIKHGIDNYEEMMRIFKKPT